MRRRVEDNRSCWQSVDIAGEEESISSPDESTTGSVSLGSKASVEFGGQHWAIGADREPDRIAEDLIVSPPAKSTRTMTGGQRHCVIEKEQRSPGSRSIDRMFPVAKLGVTRDPQRPVVMTNQSPGIVNQTTTVPGEQPA
jgi:hypothetical protein